MKTLIDYLNACIEFEEVYGAYCIYYLLKERHALPSTLIEDVEWVLVNEIEVQELIKENPLCIKRVMPYAIKGRQSTMIVLAESEEQVRGLLLQKFGRIPKYIEMPQSKMETSFWFEENKCYKTLREYAETIKKFPEIAFYV